MNQPLSKNKLNYDFSLANYKILIVDDSPTNLSLIVDYLEDYGLNILIAEDGKSSLERAKYAKPNIILLDVLMPGIDGYETCTFLKQDSETQDIPVIFMTALSSIEDKVKGFEVGAVDYVIKPIQPEEVLARIKLHLKLRFMSQAVAQKNKILKIEVEQRKIAQNKLSETNSRLEQEIKEKITTQKALQKLNFDLENRVKERTILLANSNKKLQQEIIERKHTENNLKTSLIEKELLIKEIYHRVKNNLVVICSLLEMQASYIDNPEVIKMFNNSQERIYSMAIVHEQLYLSDSLNKIDLSNYIKALLENISNSYENKQQKINFVVNTEKININIETANSCGLIINEMVTNAVKHAFVNQATGNIWLTLQRQIDQDDSGKIVLTIEDDGIGLPNDFDLGNIDSLGLTLVNILTKQIEGQLEIYQNGNRGSCFKLTFAELYYSDRL